MNEGRNANKPQRRWSRPSPSNQRSNPRPEGSRRHGQISANAEKSYHSYTALAREAASKDDTIAAENFYQHAEHFLRLLKESTS
jgi:Domain of unknown function (DUF4167)